MILKAECTIDIDERRKVWVEIAAKPEPGEDPAEVISPLAEAVADAALRAYSRVQRRRPETARDRSAELATFGDEDDDD